MQIMYCIMRNAYGNGDFLARRKPIPSETRAAVAYDDMFKCVYQYRLNRVLHNDFSGLRLGRETKNSSEYEILDISLSSRFTYEIIITAIP